MPQDVMEFASRHGNVDVEDLDERLPYVIKGAELMSPGVWNDLEFTEQEIEEALQRTDFDDADVQSLFNEHDDRDSRDWVGRVRNFRMSDDGDLLGDIELLDLQQAIKLAGGAEFGISAKVTGETEGQRMKDFVFDNFSLVLNPAVKTTFLNSEVQEVREAETNGDFTMSEQDDEEAAEAAEDQQEDQTETPELDEDTIEALAKEVADYLQEEDETAENAEEDVESDDADAEVDEEVEEDVEADAESDEEDADADTSVDDDLEGFDQFAQEYRDENPDASISDVAEAYEESQKDASEKIDEVANEFKQEIKDLKDELQSLKEQDDDSEDEIDVEKFSRKIGEKQKNAREEVQELSDKELDKKVRAMMLRNHGQGHLAGDV